MRVLLLLDNILMVVHRVVFAEIGRGAVMARQEMVILDVQVGGAWLHVKGGHICTGTYRIMVRMLNLLHCRNVHFRQIGHVLYLSGSLFGVLHLLIAHVRRAYILAYNSMQLLPTANSLITYRQLRHKVTD